MQSAQKNLVVIRKNEEIILSFVSGREIDEAVLFSQSFSLSYMSDINSSKVNIVAATIHLVTVMSAVASKITQAVYCIGYEIFEISA